MSEKIASRYALKGEIGKGSFGIIHVGEHIVTHEQVAIKLQNNHTQSKQLRNENKIYKVLSGCPGIPQVYWFGTEGKYDVLVMELLGNNLEGLHHQFPKFSLKTGLMIADQMILLIQYMHERHFIHRDIKPENFLIGSETNKKNNIIYLIDFGLSKKYRDPKTKEHIPYSGDRELVGTARYVSINTHLGIEQSRRDDLESIGYVLIYLLKGSLPWQGFQGKNEHEKYEKIAEKKMTTSYETLCEGLPSEFIQYFETVRNLEFTADPPYNELRQMFRSLFIRLGYVYDDIYDWDEAQNKDNGIKKDTIPMHSPLFQGAETGLVPPLTTEEREFPNVKTRKPTPASEFVTRELPKETTSEQNKEEHNEETDQQEKAKTPSPHKWKHMRVWVDPGKRRPFPRGPPPIPAKMLPPQKAKITKPRPQSTMIESKNSPFQVSFEKMKLDKNAVVQKTENLQQLYGGELYPWTTMTTEEQVRLAKTSALPARARKHQQK